MPSTLHAADVNRVHTQDGLATAKAAAHAPPCWQCNTCSIASTKLVKCGCCLL